MTMVTRTALVALMSACLTMAANTKAAPADRLERQVRHELIMLPYYGVFDDIAYRLEGNKLTLYGHVTRPTLRTDAERVVERIEGLQTIVNQIEVLPLSAYDDRIRLDLYRAIYGHSALSQYSVRAVPPIHIIVKNGNVTLVGQVLNTLDRTVAHHQALAVPGVFSVVNSLTTETGSAR